MLSTFLVADTQLYKRLCPSVRPSVGPLVRWSVGPSVGPSVTIELESGKTRISAPAHPSATDGRVSGLVHTILIALCIFLPKISNWDLVYRSSEGMNIPPLALLKDGVAADNVISSR